jgi:tripartite-type tricarboxylate transporter receptor subunit TctC
MKTESRIPRLENSALGTQDSELARGGAMKNIISILLIVTVVVVSAIAHAQQNFFQGKSIRVIRGGQPGDLYDLWTRHIAAYLGKHIPGNPGITVQNMPGAGSVIAANYVYNIAKPDGLTLGSLNSGIYMDQLIARKEVQFDWAKFNWLGTPEPTELVFIIRGDSPYKTIDDLRKASEPPKCGSTGTASITYHIPKLIEDVLGAKSAIIAGYQGAADIDVALERGELQCRLITIAAFFGPNRTSPGSKRASPVRCCRPAENEMLCCRTRQLSTS